MSLLKSSDTEVLLAQAKSGNAVAREKLLDRHRERLRGMIRYRMDPRISSRVDASDVIQDALMTAHARLPRYLQEPHIDFYPWLRRIAWNRLIDLQRQHLICQRRSVTREVDARGTLSDDSTTDLAERLAGPVATPLNELARRELLSRVRAAVSQLRPTDQEVLMLRFLEQLSVRESAQVMGITEGSFKTKQLRALKRLRDHLDREMGRQG